MRLYFFLFGVAQGLLGCVGLNTATLQTGRVLNGAPRADVGLVAGGGQGAQMPVALGQYRFLMAPGREVQLRWTVPGWPHFAIKQALVDDGLWAAAALGGGQYSQVDLGTTASGQVLRKHRFDTTGGLLFSWHTSGDFLGTFPLSPYATPLVIGRIQAGGGLSFALIPALNVGLEMGHSAGLSWEVGVWYHQGLNGQMGVSAFF